MIEPKANSQHLANLEIKKSNKYHRILRQDEKELAGKQKPENHKMEWSDLMEAV